LCAALLVRHAPAAVAGAYCATRLGHEGGRGYGTLPAGCDLPAILSRISRDP
jgi:putative acyl-CoA dehydrogenase